MSEKRVENLIILGGGPAGYTAALYAARANLEPLVDRGLPVGRPAPEHDRRRELPRLPRGDHGAGDDAASSALRPSASAPASSPTTPTRVELSDGGIQRVFIGDEEHLAKAIILSMGAEPKRLGIPGELELGGRGVSTCGVCDGAFFKGEDVAVIGGGDSAMEDSIFISKYADDLSIVHRRPEFRASKIMLERAEAVPTSASRRRTSRRSSSPATTASSPASACATPRPARPRRSTVGGAFVAIGHTPRSELVTGQVETDENGYVAHRRPARPAPSSPACSPSATSSTTPTARR